MRTRSRGQESDSPIDEDSRESFPDVILSDWIDIDT